MGSARQVVSGGHGDDQRSAQEAGYAQRLACRPRRDTWGSGWVDVRAAWVADGRWGVREGVDERSSREVFSKSASRTCTSE